MKQFVLFLCVGTLALFSACKFAEDASVIEGVGGRTLYVSAEGNDYNDGLTEDSAWRTLTRVNKEPLGPDDQVLFRRGDVWVCNDERPNRTGLVPQGRGNAGHPVVIGTYGTGANRPVIAGSGVPEAVRIEKMEYVRVEGLKITNDDQFGWLGDTSLKGPQDRCGVDVNVLHVDYNPNGNYVRVKNGKSTPDYGAMRGIELVDLEICDVYGYAIHSNDSGENAGRPMNENSHWWLCGGIIMSSSEDNSKNSAAGLVSQGQPVGHLVDPLVKDCYIHDIWCCGIYADNSPAYWDQDTSIFPAFSDMGAKIENTVIRYTGGEGICLVNSFWNWTIDGCGVYDLSYIPDGLGWYAGALYAGNNGIIQNCEVARMYYTEDSHAFDNDMTSHGIGIIQFNYVRDMAGTFLMNWPGTDHGETSSIVRYNIGVNVGDYSRVYKGAATNHSSLFLFGTNSSTYIYNNVFYDDRTNNPFRIVCQYQDRAAFVNNVFWNNASPILDLSTWKNGQAAAGNPNFVPAYFDHNMYYSPGNNAPDVVGNKDYDTATGFSWASDGDKNRVTGDPGYTGVIPSTVAGGAGVNLTGGNRDLLPGYQNDTSISPYTNGFNGLRDIRALAAYFRITKDSPLYQAGRVVSKDEVNYYLWGDRGKSGAPWFYPEGVSPYHISMRTSSKDMFDSGAGTDFYGNPVPITPSTEPSAQPSVGICEP